MGHSKLLPMNFPPVAKGGMLGILSAGCTSDFPNGLGSTADGVNNGATQNATGHIGTYSWEFNGSSDYVELGGGSWLNGLDEFSFSTWLYFDSLTGYPLINDKWGAGGGGAGNLTYGVNIHSGNSRFNNYIGTWSQEATGSTVSTGAWLHLGWVYNGTGTPSVKVFHNGSLINTLSTSVPSTLPTTSVNWRIGALGHGGNYFNGKVDQTIFWDKAISNSDITTLYNSGSGITSGFPESDSIKVYYNFEQTSGNLINQAIPC